MTRSDDESSWPQDGGDSAKTSSTEAWWKGELAPPRRGRRLTSAASPPVTVGRWIAYVNGEGRLVLRDHRTGQHRWEADLLDKEVDLFDLSAPAITSEVVCIRSSQDWSNQRFYLCGFALDTGRELWIESTDYSVESSPTVADGIVLIGDTGGRCYAINAIDGSFRWEVSLGEEAIDRPPAAAGGIAYVPVDDGIVHAIDIRRGKVLWPAVTGSHSASIAVSGDTLLASCDDRLLGIDAQSGERRWRRRVWIDGGLAISHGSVVACGGSTVYSMAIADGAVRWERQLEGAVGSPSVAGNVIFVASQEPARLYGLSLNDGRELWHVELERRPRRSAGRADFIDAPIPIRGRVLVTVEEGAIEVWRFNQRSGRSDPS